VRGGDCGGGDLFDDLDGEVGTGENGSVGFGERFCGDFAHALGRVGLEALCGHDEEGVVAFDLGDNFSNRVGGDGDDGHVDLAEVIVEKFELSWLGDFEAGEIAVVYAAFSEILDLFFTSADEGDLVAITGEKDRQSGAPASGAEDCYVHGL